MSPLLRRKFYLIFVPAKLGMDRVEEITIEDGRLLAGKDLTFID